MLAEILALMPFSSLANACCGDHGSDHLNIYFLVHHCGGKDTRQLFVLRKLHFSSDEIQTVLTVSLTHVPKYRILSFVVKFRRLSE